MPADPEHITIIRSGAIGDFVLTLPAVNALQLAYPRSRLRLIGNPSILRLGPVRNLIDINSAEIAGLYNPEGAVPERTRALFAGVDLLLAYAVDPDRRLQTRLSEIVRGRAIVFDPRPKRDTHITDHLLAPLHRISVPVSDPIPRIPLNEIDLDHSRGILQRQRLPSPLVAIHPGSGGRGKCWPLPSFLKLARKLRARGAGVFTLCGPVERQMVDALRAHVPSLIPGDLRSLAGLLRHADLFVGNDSGPGHIAAAVGTPTLTMFGPTDAETWGPRHPISRVLKAPDGHLPSLSVESVLRAVLDMFASVSSRPPDSQLT